jgi:competence protein ComEA
MKDWLKEYKIYFISAILLAIGGIYYFYFYKPVPPDISSLENKEDNFVTKTKQVEAESKKELQNIMVDIKGQVQHPGIYQSTTDERVMDVINRAGGFTGKADQNQVNLAEHVHDEMVIYIPGKGEDVPSQAAGTESSAAVTGSTAASQGKVDLNKADLNQLQTLPGIGPAKAAAIIEYREKTGKFKAPEDLKNISGIGDKTFDKLKDLIVVH